MHGGDVQEKGVIAGALENGSLDLWDAAKLLNKDRLQISEFEYVELG